MNPLIQLEKICLVCAAVLACYGLSPALNAKVPHVEPDDVARPPGGTTNPATKVASFSATLNGSFSNRGGETTTVHFQYGPTTSYGFNTPMQTETGTTLFRAISANIGGLSASTTYHFRIVINNGTAYGSDRTFTTLSPTGPPVAITNPASYIARFSARLNGSIDPHGLTTTVYFQYGTTTSYGLTTAPQSKTGNTYQNVAANISGLTASTRYHFRIVATNSAGTVYGSDSTFITPAFCFPFCFCPPHC